MLDIEALHDKENAPAILSKSSNVAIQSVLAFPFIFQNFFHSSLPAVVDKLGREEARALTHIAGSGTQRSELASFDATPQEFKVDQTDCEKELANEQTKENCDPASDRKQNMLLSLVIMITGLCLET